MLFTPSQRVKRVELCTTKVEGFVNMEHIQSSAPQIAFKSPRKWWNCEIFPTLPCVKQGPPSIYLDDAHHYGNKGCNKGSREGGQMEVYGRAGCTFSISILRPLFAVGSLHCARRGSYLDRSSVPSSLCPHPNPQTILRVALPRQLSPQKILDSRASVICLDVCRRGLTLWEEK